MPLFVVAGMHRSGTSALTGAAELLGAWVGDREDHIDALPEQNRHGFFELRAFKELNERLLAHLDGDWRTPPTRVPGWHADPALAPLVDEARALLDRLPVAEEVVVLKDPRASLTLPFWQALAEVDGVLVAVRHPAEVADSLARRNALPTATSAWLWCTYTAAAVTAVDDPFVVHYADLVGDPLATAARVAARLGLPAPDGDTEQALRAFLDRDLRHHEADEEVAPELRHAVELHDRVRVGDLRSDVVRWTEAITATSTGRSRSQAEVRLVRKGNRLGRRLREARQEVERLEAELATAEASAAAARDELALVRDEHARLRNRRAVRLALRLAAWAGPLVRRLRPRG